MQVYANCRGTIVNIAEEAAAKMGLIKKLIDGGKSKKIEDTHMVYLDINDCDLRNVLDKLRGKTPEEYLEIKDDKPENKPENKPNNVPDKPTPEKAAHTKYIAEFNNKYEHFLKKFGISMESSTMLHVADNQYRVIFNFTGNHAFHGNFIVQDGNLVLPPSDEIVFPNNIAICELTGNNSIRFDINNVAMNMDFRDIMGLMMVAKQNIKTENCKLVTVSLFSTSEILKNNSAELFSITGSKTLKAKTGRRAAYLYIEADGKKLFEGHRDHHTWSEKFLSVFMAAYQNNGNWMPFVEPAE